LLALFGKETNMQLIKFLNYEPTHEVGICGEAYSIIPHGFISFPYSDDDIFYECNKHFNKKEIKIRNHPMVYDRIGIGRESLQNDPAPFILSCKRITSVQSQIALKALLWNRTVFLKSELLPLAYMCEKDILGERKATEAELSYYMLGFLIPSNLMFDVAYWRWRLEKKPSENVIYQKHLNEYLKTVGVSVEGLEEMPKIERFRTILKKRGIEEKTIRFLMDESFSMHINYDVLRSQIYCKNGVETIFSERCINSYMDENVYSKFVIKCTGQTDTVVFDPFIDVGGYCCIQKTIIDNEEIARGLDNSYEYVRKTSEGIIIQNSGLSAGEHEIEIVWKYKFSQF